MDNIKCFIFDFDDTIIYSEKIKKEEFFNISKKYNNIGINYYNQNIDKRLNRFDYFNNLSKVIINKTLLNNENDIILYQLLLKEFSKNITNKLKDANLLKNIEKFLNFLKSKKFKIYISSKSNIDDIISTLKHKNLINYFDDIYGSEENKINHFEKIIKNNNLNNNEICFFGDSYSDYEVAIHFDCQFIGILTDRNDLKKAECKIIDDYDKVIDLF